MLPNFLDRRRFFRVPFRCRDTKVIAPRMRVQVCRSCSVFQEDDLSMYTYCFVVTATVLWKLNLCGINLCCRSSKVGDYSSG